MTEGQVIYCKYTEKISSEYSCNLDMILKENLMNSTDIGGAHMDNKSDDDVVKVMSDFLTISGAFPLKICEKFKNLKVLDLSETLIDNVKNYSLENCKNLESLSVHFGEITELPENLLISNKKLTNLKIKGNYLQSFSKNLLESQHQLLEILEIESLSETYLQDPDFFQPLEELICLNIRIVNLKSLGSEWFKTLKKLEIIKIISSNISNLPKNIFSSLQNLRKISLRDNKLSVIHSDSFAKLENLNFLDFSRNQIYAIDAKIFQLKSLRVINLLGNLCNVDIVADASQNRVNLPFYTNQCTNNFTLSKF